MSNISAVIDSTGESLAIKRRQQTGTDPYGKPIYTWNTVATERIFLQPLDAKELHFQFYHRSIETGSAKFIRRFLTIQT